LVEATKAGLGGVISGLCVKVRDARPEAFRLKLFVTIGHPDVSLIVCNGGVGSEQTGKPGLDHGDVLAQRVAADLEREVASAEAGGGLPALAGALVAVVGDDAGFRRIGRPQIWQVLATAARAAIFCAALEGALATSGVPLMLARSSAHSLANLTSAAKRAYRADDLVGVNV
jgi:hypothetical protein